MSTPGRISTPLRRGVRCPRQRGMSLIELMIALALGLIITASVLTVYVNAGRNFAFDEQYGRMQENARYALRVIGEDLVMGDFWGPMVTTDTISADLAPPPGDCGETVALFDPRTAMLFNANSATASPNFVPCTTVSANLHGSSDVIAIKRVAGRPTARVFVDAADSDGDGDTTETLSVGIASLVDGQVYLRTNGTSGALIHDASAANPPAVGWSDWRYTPRVYFVRDHFQAQGDGVPALCRLDIAATSLSALSCLAEGVEDMHLEFGLDTDIDGSANRFTATPTAAEMNTVVTARVHLLMRSSNTIPFYDNQTSFRLGAKVVPAANDGYLRGVYSTTVAIRNSANRNLFN